MTREEVDKICRELGLKNYHINDDLTVNSFESVNLLNKDYHKLPIKFKEVSGTFNCGYGKLRTLEGCPDTISSDFVCNNNELSSLKGAPTKIGGGFFCANNRLTSLIGIPPLKSSVNMVCDNNPLDSLEGCPSNINVIDICNTNVKNLSDLQGVRFSQIRIHRTPMMDWLRIPTIGYEDFKFLSKLEEIIFIPIDEGHKSIVSVNTDYKPNDKFRILVGLMNLKRTQVDGVDSITNLKEYDNNSEVSNYKLFMKKNKERIDTILESDFFLEFMDRLEELCEISGLEIGPSRELYTTTILGGDSNQLAIGIQISKKSTPIISQFKGVNEKYSLPDSVEKLSGTLINFVCDKFEWWWNRKGLANFNDHYSLPIKYKNQDFPVRKINLDLEIVLSKRYDDLNRTGMSHTFNSEEAKMRPKIYSNGECAIGIRIKIFVPRNKNSYSEEEIFEVVQDMVLHELFHSFQAYKMELKGIPDEPHRLDIPYTIYYLGEEIHQYKFFDKFVNTAYLFTSFQETGAHIAQLHANGGDYWVKTFLKIYHKSFEEILEKIREEVKKEDEPKIVKAFNKIAESVASKDVLHFDRFEDLIRYIYDLIDKKKEYVFRKIAKLKHSIGQKMVNEKYSFPDSAKGISEQILDHIMVKVENWRSKIVDHEPTGDEFLDLLGNDSKFYKNISQVIPKSTVEDFPVNKVKLRLELNDSKGWSYHGGAHLYRSSDVDLKPKIHDNKMVDIGIEITLHIPRSKSSQDIIKDIKGVIYHEVLHCYQHYKQKLKGIDPSASSLSKWIIQVRKNICGIHYTQRKIWANFLKLVYLTSTRQELDATMASTQTPSWYNYVKRMYHEIYDIPKEKLRSLLLDEISLMSEFNAMEQIMRIVNKRPYYYGKEDTRRKPYQSFDEFFEEMYQFPLRRRKYVERKLAKISTL